MGPDFNQDNLTSKPFLKPQEMADYLNVSLKKIYRLVESRAIPFYKIDRSLRFKKEDVDAYLEKALVKSIPNKYEHI